MNKTDGVFEAMQINTVKRKIQSSGLSNSRATFSSALNSKLFDILAGLYTNIPDAIVRELIANGLDASKEAGNAHTPLDVHVPTRLEPFFSVRDYGAGMTHEFMMDSYSVVGFSSKDQSNEMIGGFGIGRISALAYTDSYTVECINGGEKRIYTIFKNEDGLPDVVQMGSTIYTDDEPSGTTVKVAVKDHDIRRFSVAIMERFQWYSVQPNVNDPSVIPEPVKWVNKTDLWGKADYSNIDCIAVMGEIAYRVNVNQVDDNYNWGYNLRRYLEDQFVMFFDIGELSIAPNREELQYDDHTIEKIRNRVKQMQDDVVKTWQAKLDKCANIWDARKTRHAAFRDTYNLLGNNMVKGMFTYQGKPINHEFYISKKDNRFKPHYSKVMFVENYKLNRNKSVPLSGYVMGDTFPILATQDTEDNMRIYVSTPEDKRLNSRLCKHVQAEGAGRSGNSIVIKANSEADKQAVFDYLHNVHYIPRSMFVDVTAEVDDYKVVRSSNGGGTYIKSEKPQNVYRMDIDDAIRALYNRVYQYQQINSQKHNVKQDEDVDVQNGTGFYVTVKAWEAYHGEEERITDCHLRLMLEYLKQNKGVTEVYFVTKGGKDPFKDVAGWQQVYDYCKAVIKKTLTDPTQQSIFRSTFKANNFKQHTHYNNLKKLVKFKELVTNKELLKFIKLAEYVESNKDAYAKVDTLVQLLEYFSSSSDKTILAFKNMKYLEKKFDDKFNNVFAVLDFPWRDTEEDRLETIIQLLNGLDS